MALRDFPDKVRRELGKTILDLQMGRKLSMPLSRPMPAIAPGVEELRIKGSRWRISRVLFRATGDGNPDFSRVQKENAENASA